jgi:hypothetical protein
MKNHPGAGETPTFTGSMVTALVESEEELREILSKDVYATSGVWDVEKAQIIPVSIASYVGEKKESMGRNVCVLAN